MIQAQPLPLPAGLHSALSLISLVMQAGLPEPEFDHAAAEPDCGYDGGLNGRMNPDLMQFRMLAETHASECVLSGRQLSRPRRWGINE